MEKKKKIKVAIGMSGGVDSSVAAALLKEQGYEVVGIFMQFWFPEGEIYGENRCCSLKSFNEAKQVADILDIPLHKLNFGEPFKKIIVDEFLKEYRLGKTPNPCVACNKFIKFDLLLKKARTIFGVDYLATGHYVKSVSSPRMRGIRNKESGPPIESGMTIMRSKDKNKDQTYFLYNLKQSQLKHVLFPVGGYEKDEIRKLAKKYKLPVHDKKDSQEICFVGESHYDFLKKYLKLKPGKIITYSAPHARGGATVSRSGGWELGEHQGLPLYTIGQRSGIGLSGGPWYVCGFDHRKNVLVVTKNEKNSTVYQKELICSKVNWISGEPKFPLKCQTQVRYRAKPANCVVEKEGKKLRVSFVKKQRAIMPGQSVVFYKGDELLGGGIIN